MIQKRFSPFYTTEHFIIAILLSIIVHAVLFFLLMHSIQKQPKLSANLTVKLQSPLNQQSGIQNNLSVEKMEVSNPEDLTDLITRVQKIEAAMHAAKNRDQTSLQERNQSFADPNLSAVEYKPTLLYRPNLQYPSMANGLEGTVMIAANITANGSLTDINVKQSSGYPILDRTASKSAVSWRFVPPPKGMSVPVEIPFVFESCDKQFL